MGRHNNYNPFHQRPVTISKPFVHTCHHGRKVLMAFVQAHHSLYTMGIHNHYGTFRFTKGHTSGYYPFTNVPAVLPNPKCPKAFTILSNGEMLEYFK